MVPCSAKKKTFVGAELYCYNIRIIHFPLNIVPVELTQLVAALGPAGFLFLEALDNPRQLRMRYLGRLRHCTRKKQTRMSYKRAKCTHAPLTSVLQRARNIVLGTNAEVANFRMRNACVPREASLARPLAASPG